MKPLLILSLLVTSAIARKPNIILIYMDDMGYGDIGCYGSTKNRTPILDHLAKNGMRFTDFYVTSGVCTPSRSSLLTGCYPRRLNMHVDQNDKWVLFPNARKGLNPNETTIAEILKAQGYATTCIGKWHLGDQPEFLPTKHGFDSYFGIPYSNDMGRKNIPLPLLRDDKVIEAPVAQSPVTRRYTEEAISFVRKNRDKPFFLYLPHTSVHLPLFPGEGFKGKSSNGKYGDWIEEVDACTGRLLAVLKQEKLVNDTLIIFSSDNGSNNRNGGSNTPLKGGKGSTHEGGMRVPCIMHWPGKIPANSTCSEISSTLDFLPTLTALSGGKLPTKKIDGHNIIDLLFANSGAKSPHTAFYYYHTTQLQAVRSEKWKLVLPQTQKFEGWSGKKKDTKTQLFDLLADAGESTNLAEKHPDIVAQLTELANRAREDLGDDDRKGKGQRPAGWVDEAKPLLLQK
ncbi:MAG: sulfatase [Akkermansiaceae bacterium]